MAEMQGTTSFIQDGAKTWKMPLSTKLNLVMETPSSQYLTDTEVNMLESRSLSQQIRRIKIHQITYQPHFLQIKKIQPIS